MKAFITCRFPKSLFHVLVVARKHKLLSVSDLAVEDLDLLRHMKVRTCMFFYQKHNGLTSINI